MTAPIPPPPVLDRAAGGTDRETDRTRRRPGQLTLPWRVLTVVMWGLVFLAFTGVWKVSRELGLATWWLGPPSEPQPFLVMLIPFYLPSAMVVAALNNAPRVPLLGLVASAVTAVVGVVDLGRVVRLGIVELAIATAGAVFSLASLSGTYRRPRPL